MDDGRFVNKPGGLSRESILTVHIGRELPCRPNIAIHGNGELMIGVVVGEKAVVYGTALNDDDFFIVSEQSVPSTTG